MPPARTKPPRLKRERASDRSRKPRGPLPPELEHHGSGGVLRAVRVLVPFALVLTLGPIAASRFAGSTGLGGPLDDRDFGSSRTSQA